MKKIYFILFLLVSGFSNGQPLSLNDYSVCDVNSSGIAQFDLTTKTAEIYFILNNGQYAISYYETFADAEAGTNPILNPQTYSNISNPQRIFAGAGSTETEYVALFEFSLIVTLPPIANPAVLTFCDPLGIPNYNLNDATPQLIGDQQNLSIVYYDAPNGNVITSPISFIPTLPVHVLGVTISNDCFFVNTTITLNTNNCSQQPCPGPTVLSVSNVTSSSARLGWASTAASFEVYLAPTGSPAPNANTTATYFSQSSQFTAFNLTSQTCYQFYVKAICNPIDLNFSSWIGPFNFCTQNCSNNGQCNDRLNLIAFFDNNNNGIKDNTESTFNMGQFEYEINNSGNLLYGSADYGGFSIFDNNPDNTYDLSFTINNDLTPYFSSFTTYNNIQSPTGNGPQIFYFPVTNIQSFIDLSVDLIPTVPPRPGFTNINYLRIKNKGTQPIASCNITFMKDPAVSIINVTPFGNVNTTNGFTYEISNLSVNEEFLIQIEMQVPTIPIINLGQTLTSSVSLSLSVGDVFPNNNSASLSQIIVGSYDPNDKTEAHGGKIGLDYFSDNDYLTYTIQFENTGSASAEFIRVEDLLDSGLDADSVVMLNASHPYNMRRIDNKLIWNFYEVNLPPTSTNPTQSHGFIQFKIKPTAGYTIGTMIPNAANIYFDYNPAIVTNTFQTEFLATLSTSSFAANGFYMYPNPTKTFIYLGLKDTAESITNITIRDVLGKSVKVINTQSNETSIDVSVFSKGIYFVEITTKNHLKMIKKLIVN